MTSTVDALDATAAAAGWRSLSFPLNVYAALLQLSEGRVDYLHYGLFADDDEAVHLAQERASQRVWAHMPAPGCRVLEVGIGLGTTLNRLAQRGYRAVGITPDAAQVAQVQRRYGDSLEVQTQRLEDVQPGAEPFDVMLLQESAQYIDPLALFTAAHKLLSNNDAQLLVVDEFALRRDSSNDATLHLLSDFLDLAARFGWHVEVDEDLTAQAAPTVAVLQGLSARFGPQVVQDLGIQAAQWQGLQAGLAQYARSYAGGAFGYRLLSLRRRRRPPTQLLPLQTDGAGMRELFSQVFKHVMPLQTWRWKYRPGLAHAVAMVGDDGALVAHYAGFSRPLQVLGKAVLGCQIGDVMVAPQADGSLARHRALRQVTSTFLERHIGWGRSHAIGFGFPNARAMAVAQRLGLYEPVDHVLQLRWTGPASWASPWPTEALPADGSAWTAELKLELLQLWQDMAAALPDAVLGVRDPDWLHWRYTQRPDVRYGLMLLRSRRLRKAMGLAVTRTHADGVELLDLVAAPRRFAMLLNAVRVQAAAAGQASVRAWITASHQHLLSAIDPLHLSVEDPKVTVPANAHTAGPPASLVRDRWFLMSGDADFT
jgi:hypothetical protein